MSITEAGNLKALVFRNDSATNGDLYLEGTIKQIKSFLRSYVVVKPACMLDNHIKVDFTIKYSRNGRYNDKYVREVTQNLTQVEQQSRRQELDHQYKYRFLVYDETNNNIKPLFSKDQTITGGAGDLMIVVTGIPGSGFERCDATQ